MAKDFSAAINEVMPLVQDGDKSTPFIVSRDSAYGDWLVLYPYPAENADSFLESQREHDPYAVMFTGADFAKGGFAHVYEKILCARLRAEYDDMPFGSGNIAEYRALVNLLEDNIGSLSSDATEYISEQDKPLSELYGILPISLKSELEGELYDESMVDEALETIEYQVSTVREAEPNKETQREIDAMTGKGKAAAEPKRVIDGHYTEKFSVSLDGREVILAVDEKEDAPYLVCTARWDNPFGATEYFDDEVIADYLEAMREFVDRVDTLVYDLEKERAAFPTVQPTLTAADCVPRGLDESLTGKVVVIKPTVLSPEYRTADHQLKIVQGGFGAEPNARGNAVFCKDLYSDKETRFERYDIAGVVDPAKLPQWAKDKLAYLEALKEPGVFAFGGYHFKPYRHFEKRDGDFQKQMDNAASDHSLGIATYEWKKNDYSHAAFYSASGDSQADIFRCVENGRLYIPCENELFRYNEPPVKAQTKGEAEKPSIRDRLKTATEAAAEQKAPDKALKRELEI